jgi:methylamine utilization protein MauE
MIDPTVSLLLALAFAALFGSAAGMKVRAPAIFVATLADYRLVPRALLQATGFLVIAIEVAVAIGLLWPATRAASGVIGASLLGVYGLAIAINLARGRQEIDCGCSLRRRPIGRWMVARNFVFAAALLVVTLPVAARPLGFGDAATIGAGLLVLALLYGSLDLLLGRPDLRRPFSPEHS